MAQWTAGDLRRMIARLRAEVKAAEGKSLTPLEAAIQAEQIDLIRTLEAALEGEAPSYRGFFAPAPHTQEPLSRRRHSN